MSAKEPTTSPGLSSPEREQEAPPLSPSELAQDRTPPPQASVADLSAPLPPLQEQVAVGNNTPFSACPPLSSEEHSPQEATETPTEPHGGTPPTPQMKESQAVISTAPTATKLTRRKRENKQHVQAEFALPQETRTTITKRKNCFGIEVRSTRWY